MLKLLYYWSIILVSLIALSCKGRVLVTAQFNQYDFPELYKFDDYDKCFHKKRSDPIDTTYCMVYAEIKPNNSSELWRNIINHWETNIFHYRYDRLFFGVCMERCKMYGEIEDTKETQDYRLSNEYTEFYEKIHKRPLDLMIRTNYSQMIYKCLNDEFNKKYNLNLQIFVKYCEGKNELQQLKSLAEKDSAEIYLNKSLQIIFLLIVLSTFYDFCLKKQQTEENQTNDFYKNKLQQKSTRLLTSFSICRNYYRILQPYHGEVGKDFAFLDCYRSVTTLCVLFGHILYAQGIHIGNPDYFDTNTDDKVHKLLINALLAIEIYMVMSGLFFYLKFTQAGYITPASSLKKCFKIFVLLLSSRFLRYLPSLGLLVWVYATKMPRLLDGPFWRHMTDQGYVFSRENWWKNILMINNFSPKDTMAPHTWYMAADFQIFAFYSIVLIIMAKYPQYKSHIMKILAVLSILIPTAISYVYNLRSAFVVKGESFRHGYFTDKEFHYLYTPFYTNLGGYLFGIYCGQLYMNSLRKPEVQQKYRGVLKYELGGYLSVVIAFLIVFIGSCFMFCEPSIWTALHSGLHRNAWIVFVCGPPLLGMAMKGGWIAYEFCCLPIFRFLARMSFQTYLWHLLILQMCMGYIRQPFHMNGFYFTTLIFLLWILSTIVSFVIALAVEYPFAQILETLQVKRQYTQSEDSTKETKIK